MDDVANWAHAVDESLQHTNWTPDKELVVLAETTIIAKSRHRGSPREIRYSVLEPVVTSSFPTGGDPHELYGVVRDSVVSEYESLSEYEIRSQSPNSIPLAIRNVTPGYYYSPGADWTAFNPVIARSLGWSLANDGMFRWVDPNGFTMVESIWWVDGLVTLSASRPSSEEVGEGWLVLASQFALEEIQREFGTLTRQSIVIRQYRSDGEQVDRSATSSQLV